MAHVDDDEGDGRVEEVEADNASWEVMASPVPHSPVKVEAAEKEIPQSLGHTTSPVHSDATTDQEDKVASSQQRESQPEHVDPPVVDLPSSSQTASMPPIDDDVTEPAPSTNDGVAAPPCVEAPSSLTLLTEDEEPGTPSSTYSSQPQNGTVDDRDTAEDSPISPMPQSPTFSDLSTPGFEDAVSVQPNELSSSTEGDYGFVAELPTEPITSSDPGSPEPAYASSPPRIDTTEKMEDVEDSAPSPLLQSPTDTKAKIERPASISSLHNASPPETPVAPVSPLTHAEASMHTSTFRDSMASIALSESSLDYDHLSPEAVEQALATPRVRASRHTRKPSSLEILQNMWAGDSRPQLERQNTLFDAMKDQPSPTPIEIESGVLGDEEAASQLKAPEAGKWHKRTSSLNAPQWTPDASSDEQIELDWQQLDREEEWEKEDKDLPAGAEDESTAFLLARLEQENAKITLFSNSTDSSSSTSKAVDRVRRESRPPSMRLLKRLVSDRNAPSVRYSLALSPDPELLGEVPEPPPMTELEFWAALVQDYPSTAVRLPTLTTSKIRGGIPPPLRGVVWQSMAGARDRTLEDAFERLQHEQSPYEGIINKDVGRSFPGVELFRDAEGEGQKMLGRVLKCYSLHDKDIGYCQGLGFLVGPLLMNMGEREAFCVLVRLMVHYSLRPSFLPSLSGLHMRIYQFSSLIKQHHPALSAHLTDMGIESAYLSQWFLSCFAVTCPLPMLFRIYDVIFAEGANETVMRVALALMRRNEQRMMESTEFEEVMQLLLGCGIWDCYGIDADALVDDFTSLGGIITYARLAELEREFEKQDSEAVGHSAGFLPDVQAAASRFLGRLWAPSHGAKPSTSTLSPSAADTEGSRKTRTGSILRGSPSKHSISTLNDVSGSDGSSTNSSGSASLASTTFTEPEVADSPARESQGTDAMSFKLKAVSLRTVSISTGHGVASTPGFSKEERDMHGQIEDLLTALSEMQREHQQLAGMLQREREERGEDHLVVRRLVKRLRREEGRDGEAVSEREEKESRRKTLPPPMREREGDPGDVRQRPRSVLLAPKKPQQNDGLDDLIESVGQRLETNARLSHSFETKAELRSKLTRTREQLAAAETSSCDMSARLEIAETSLAAFTSESEDLRAEVKELRVRVNEEFKTRQKLEHAIRELRSEARVVERKERERLARTDSMQEVPAPGLRRGSSSLNEASGLARKDSVSSAPVTMVAAGGLRELRLVRRESSSSVQSLRTMRGQRPAPPEIHVQTQQPLATSPPTSATEATSSPSPPVSATVEHTPMSAATPSSGLSVPPPGMWHQRSSSLATKEVLATPEHEVIPEEALLLELVNAKTAEAQFRAEVDELKRALTLSNRRHEQMLQTLQAQLEVANASTAAARQEAQVAGDAAEQAKQEALALSSLELSVPTTPVAYDSDNKSLGGMSEMGTPVAMTPSEKGPEVPPKKEGSGSSGGGGWFWNRRTPGAMAKGAGTPPAE